MPAKTNPTRRPPAITLADYFARADAYSRQGLADLCGVTRTCISLIAKGTRTPRLGLAQKIEQHTGGRVRAAQLCGL